MADAKMNQAWWVGNKAKTLLDSGDTVSKALKLWDGAKMGKDFAKAVTCLDNVSKAATALKGKANSKLHKETIGYLQTYIDNCKEGKANLAKADGSTLVKSLTKLPKSVMDQLQKIDKMFWVRFEENLLFLNAMKSGKGSQKIYDEYIAAGSDHEVNLSNPQRAACGTAAAAGEWQDPSWAAAVKEIKSMVEKQISQGSQQGCETVEKTMQLEALQKM